MTEMGLRFCIVMYWTAISSIAIVKKQRTIMYKLSTVNDILQRHFVTLNCWTCMKDKYCKCIIIIENSFCITYNAIDNIVLNKWYTPVL